MESAHWFQQFVSQRDNFHDALSPFGENIIRANSLGKWLRNISVCKDLNLPYQVRVKETS